MTAPFLDRLAPHLLAAALCFGLAAANAIRIGTWLLVGTLAGLVGVLFRLALEYADRWRDVLIMWAQNEGIAGFLFVLMTCMTATLVAAWLVRCVSPHATGSGIPHVEAVLREEILPSPFHLIWVKFFGGLLAIGSGLALGREGPS